jgi:iron complex transport system substrate-binding protein
MMFLLRRPPSRRPSRSPATVFAAVVTAVLATVGLAACGSDGDSDAADGSDGSGGSGVSITHALGTAEIPENPERVVTLGQGSAETALSLGVVPVGMEEYPWAADASGYLPWIREELEKEHVAEDDYPELIDAGDGGVNVEQIAKLDPDVILAPWSGITQDQYNDLSALAPTVAYPEKPWTIDWKDQITTVATALGQKDRAADLIGGIDDRFAAVRDDHPEFGEHDFAFIYNQGADGNLGVFLPTEQRSAMVANLGLRVAPFVEQMKSNEKEGTDSAEFSMEEASRLNDVDVLFTFYSDDANRREMEAQPVYGDIAAIRRGSVVAPTDNAFVTASSIINPLTVPWSIDRYVPMIGDALTHVG